MYVYTVQLAPIHLECVQTGMNLQMETAVNVTHEQEKLPWKSEDELIEMLGSAKSYISHGIVRLNFVIEVRGRLRSLSNSEGVAKNIAQSIRNAPLPVDLHLEEYMGSDMSNAFVIKLTTEQDIRWPDGLPCARLQSIKINIILEAETDTGTSHSQLHFIEDQEMLLEEHAGQENTCDARRLFDTTTKVSLLPHMQLEKSSSILVDEALLVIIGGMHRRPKRLIRTRQTPHKLLPLAQMVPTIFSPSLTAGILARQTLLPTISTSIISVASRNCQSQSLRRRLVDLDLTDCGQTRNASTVRPQTVTTALWKHKRRSLYDPKSTNKLRIESVEDGLQFCISRSSTDQVQDNGSSGILWPRYKPELDWSCEDSVMLSDCDSIEDDYESLLDEKMLEYTPPCKQLDGVIGKDATAFGDGADLASKATEQIRERDWEDSPSATQHPVTAACWLGSSGENSLNEHVIAFGDAQHMQQMLLDNGSDSAFGDDIDRAYSEKAMLDESILAYTDQEMLI